MGLEIEYTNMKGKSDHIYLTFNQPSERQKLYHKIVLARQNQGGSNSNLAPDPDSDPLTPKITAQNAGDENRYLYYKAQ